MENISYSGNGLEKFSMISIGILDRLSTWKKIHNRGNNMFFINKPQTWAHMKRTHLRNQSLKNKCEVNRINFIKQLLLINIINYLLSNFIN